MIGRDDPPAEELPRTLHATYRKLVETIELSCRVEQWWVGDVDLWPVARQDLYLDLFRSAGAITEARPAPFIARAAASIAVPTTNLWRSRSDLRHWVARAHRADALLLGDGVSLDHVDGAWRDRFGEPVAAALERQGRSCFVMQSGNLTRLPWARPTYAANQLAAKAALKAALAKPGEPHLPDHTGVIRLLARAEVDAPSLNADRLRMRGHVIAAQACEFERVLHRVRPRLAFVVTHYAGMAPALAVACRRQGVLCIDLQHCPPDAWHRAYRWPNAPAGGYSTLPGLFWSWTESDAAAIRDWCDGGWHRALAGGHPQMAALSDGVARLWRQALASAADDREYEREILVTLQPIGGRRRVWEQLACEIEASPPSWRWWIRRHPASTAHQDREYTKLLALSGRPCLVEAASATPLPALLPHMDAQVSLASGSACEAAMLGVQAYFLDAEARDTFPDLLASGGAKLVDVASLNGHIANLPKRRRCLAATVPSIEDTLSYVDGIAASYRQLCGKGARQQVNGAARIVA